MKITTITNRIIDFLDTDKLTFHRHFIVQFMQR